MIIKNDYKQIGCGAALSACSLQLRSIFFCGKHISKKRITIVILTLNTASAFSQFNKWYKPDTTGEIHAELALQAIGTSADIPFWMRTNQFGSIPDNDISGSIIARAGKGYNSSGRNKLLEWGMGAEARANLGNRSQFILTELYVKGRLSIFQLKAGRSRDIIGIADSTLSAGAFAVSGNALGIPRIQLSIPEYRPVPWTKKLIAVKASLAHGWFGQTKLRTNTEHVNSINSYYHELTMYGRIGKPSWKLKLYGGFNHLAMWGNEQKIYGSSGYDLRNIQTLWYIALGKPYLKSPTGTSKIGNHMGSLDQALEYDFKNVNITAYHQFFYEVGGLYHGNNLKDGLFGIVLRNKKQQTKRRGWRKILIEYMGSKSQGGEPDAPVTPSGDEDYYNNYLYYNAWDYKGENIGSNFMTNRKYARTALPSRTGEYVVNNRVILWHAGVEGYAGKWDCAAKFSFFRNYGTYGSSPWGNSTGAIRNPGPPPYFSEVGQFSGYLSASRPLKNGYNIGFIIAADKGEMLNNSFGGLISFCKSW